jgi:hypothetical protein
LNALLAKFKASCAEPTNVEANNDTYVYDAFLSITTHHFHDLSFHAMQEINTTVYDDIVGTYVQHSYEVTLIEYKILAMNYLLIRHYDYVQLVMRSFVRYRIFVQTVCCACCLTLAQMKHSALPPGANPSLGRKRSVTSVTSNAL